MSVIKTILFIILALVIISSANYYLSKKFFQGFNYLFPKSKLKIYLFFFSFITLIMILDFCSSLLPINAHFKSFINVISSYLMGFYLYLLLFFIIMDIIIIFGKLIKIIPSKLTPKYYFISSIITIILTFTTVIYGIYHANQINHIYYDINLSKEHTLNDWNIVLISDLHLGAVNSEKQLKHIVQKINNLNPDLICIAGDFFDSDYYKIKNPNKAIALLKSLKSTYGVYATLGNHDAGSTINEMKNFLKLANIKALTDEFNIINNQLILVGRLDSQPIGGFGSVKRKKLYEIINNVDLTLPIIVMDHNPKNISTYQNDVDLILSGHTHKGQIFPANLITNIIYTVDYGHYQKDENYPHIIVTSGVGTWGMPIRIGTNSEIVSIYLH